MISTELEQLLRWMLCKEPAARITVPQLMAHAWLRQPVPIADYVFHELVDCGQCAGGFTEPTNTLAQDLTSTRCVIVHNH